MGVGSYLCSGAGRTASSPLGSWSVGRTGLRLLLPKFSAVSSQTLLARASSLPFLIYFPFVDNEVFFGRVGKELDVHSLSFSLAFSPDSRRQTGLQALWEGRKYCRMP